MLTISQVFDEDKSGTIEFKVGFVDSMPSDHAKSVSGIYLRIVRDVSGETG